MIRKNIFSNFKESSFASLAKEAVFASGLITALSKHGYFINSIKNIIVMKRGRTSGMINSL